jgi:general secretion pathway protein E
MTGHVRNLVGLKADAYMLDQVAIKVGRTIMQDDAAAKCRSGITTAPETQRLTTVR